MVGRGGNGACSDRIKRKGRNRLLYRKIEMDRYIEGRDKEGGRRRKSTTSTLF